MKESKVSKWILSNLPWIFMLLGFLFMLLGHMIKVQSQPDASIWYQLLECLPTAFKSIGTTILGGGIFAAVLKSFQFTGVFQEELAKVVYSKGYLEKQSRTYLEETWTRVSQALFTNKFPTISESVESSVLRTYFPSDHNYYYEHLVHKYYNFVLEEHDGGTYVTYDHEMTGSILPLEKSGEFLWSVHYSIVEDAYSFRKVETLTIHHEDKLVSDLKNEIEKTLETGKFEVKLSCKAKGKYRFKKVEKRKLRLDLPTNELVLFETSKVADRLSVIVTFDPKLLDIYFVHKTIESFEDMETSPGRIYRDYPGVLLPSHGFCLV